MTSIELEYAEKRMQQKWHDLVMEEQKGTPQSVLERMFNAYMLTVEEYNRCYEEFQRHQQEGQLIAVPTQGKRIKKAS